MADYDIEKAFREVEEELMKSMIRNMSRHRMEETDEKKEWEMWQALQMKALEEYKNSNRKKFQSRFSRIDKEIGTVIFAAREQGNMEQEIKILKAIQSGFKPPKALKNSTQTMAEFFRVNDRKMEALIKATQNDFKKAEYAMLRMAEDQYRQIIFNAQVYANTGAGTYEKAVDMATKDFLNRGINCIEYANGTRHTVDSYAAMAIRTAAKRAYLTGEGEKRKEWGITTVIMNKRGNACPKCLPFVGKVLIDDVWSGGKQSDGPYMLMSNAIAAGLYHPNCKDSHTTYFEGISTQGASYTSEELKKVEEDYRKEQKQQYADRQAERFTRLADGTLDADGKQKYGKKATEWKNRARQLKDLITRDTEKKVIEFENSLSSVKNIDTRILLKQSLERVEFRLSTKSTSYFDGKNVFLTKSAKGDSVAHELFHEIDSVYGLTEKGMLSSSVKSDYNRLQKLSEGYGKNIPEMLYLEYPEAFYRNKNGELKVYEEYRGISDILNGMSKKEIKLGFGHNKKGYWDAPLSVEKETFAQFGRMLYDNNEDVLEMVRKIFPSCDAEIRRILKEMVK